MLSKSEIEVLVKAHYPILYIVSWEERRVERCLTEVANSTGRKLITWSVTQGFSPKFVAEKPSQLSGELLALVQLTENTPDSSIVLLKDFHPYLRDYRVVRLLRDLTSRMRGRDITIVLMGPSLNIPIELEKEVSVVDFPLPDAAEIGAVLEKAIAQVKDQAEVDPSLDDLSREQLIKSAQGLTLDEIQSVFSRSLVEKKKFDVSVVLEEKKQIIRKSGILEYYPAAERLDSVGGMELLKDWLDKRSESFTDKAREFGIPAPRGVLLLGVQGCGKSLLAKAISAQWRLPMLKLDVGRIFGSLVGQSEDNIRKAIKTAESVAPCVLWADELEKGFAGVSGGAVSDSGTTARVFATFLTWMQEKTSPVFLIATANDVSSLPPEMLRKGRFDEIFFVDLPGLAEREQIFKIHLAKRKRSPENFDLAELAKLTKGFSGAEIEQVVVAGLYSAFENNRDLIQQDLTQEASAAVPLSRTMKEEIDDLRAWASVRTRPSSEVKND